MAARLIEHSSYTFRVVKLISLHDQKKYWILEDSNGIRYMLNAAYYSDYGISINQSIICKVDKINCSGKIYLEPNHPIYQEGNIYSFQVANTLQIDSMYPEPEFASVVTVIDVFQHQWSLTMCQIPSESCLCRIDRIKKGHLFLSDPVSKINIWYNEGEDYPFTVDDIKNTIDQGDCFFLRDENDHIHILPTANYLNYNISKGDTIICKVVKQHPSGICILEPRHPIYLPDKEYTFSVFCIEEKMSYRDIVEYVLTVVDAYGTHVQIALGPETPDKKLFSCKEVRCEIERIKKGKLFLLNPTPVNTH